ncbi:MAG: PAS domain S-box protein [Ignavibacteriaceae bacterium]
MNEKSKNNSELTITVIFLLIIVSAIFVIDAITPKGYLDWFFYLVVIFYASLKLSKKYLVVLGTISVLLTMLGYFISPDGVAPGFAVINRVIGIVIIWMLTSLLYTQYKESEQKNEIEKQFGVLLNRMSTTGIIYFDADGKITVSNKKFANILGLRIDEIIGRNILDFIHPDYRGNFLISREKLYFNFQNSDYFDGKLIKKNNGNILVNVALNITQNFSNDSKLFTAYFNLSERGEAADYIPASKILLKEISG